MKRTEELISGLSSIDTDARLAALRGVKNAVIGNKRQKLAFIRLGAVDLLTEILSADGDGAALVQAAAACASLAASEEGAVAVFESGGVQQLLRALQSGDCKVVEAAARSLKTLYKSAAAEGRGGLLEPAALSRLVSLLAAPEGSGSAEAAAAVLARCAARNPEQQAAVVAAGAVPPLAAMLSSPLRGRRDAALEALAEVSGSAAAAAAVCAAPDVVPGLLRMLRGAAAPRPRLTICACLLNLAGHLGKEDAAASQGLCVAILPVLVRLLGESGVNEEVPSLLCRLLEGRGELAAAAVDADAIPRLAGLVREGGCGPRLKEGALRALGALCMDSEPNRQQLVAARAAPAVVAALSDAAPAVAAAACLCLRSLSRSGRSLSLGEGEVVVPLLALTASADPDTAALAAGSLANLSMQHSAMKAALMAGEAVPRFAALAASPHAGLRLHAVWGLASLAFHAPPEVKEGIMASVGWPALAALLADPDVQVTEKATWLLRNLAYSRRRDVEAVLAWSGGGCGEGLLRAVRGALERPGAPAELRYHALYVVVNLACSGAAAHKAAVMAGGWPAVLVGRLGDGDARVREAATWALINLTWALDGDEGVAARVAALRELGAVAALAVLESDEALAVRERAGAALQQLRGRPGAGAGAAGGERALVVPWHSDTDNSE